MSSDSIRWIFLRRNLRYVVTRGDVAKGAVEKQLLMEHSWLENGGPGLNTHRKFNIAPENRWLEDYLPFGRVTFQGLC